MSDRHVLPPYSLRMPSELREMLELSAREAKRSLNAEIVARLEDSFSNTISASEPMRVIEGGGDGKTVMLLPSAKELVRLTGELAEQLRLLREERTNK